MSALLHNDSYYAASTTHETDPAGAQRPYAEAAVRERRYQVQAIDSAEVNGSDIELALLGLGTELSGSWPDLTFE